MLQVLNNLANTIDSRRRFVHNSLEKLGRCFVIYNQVFDPCGSLEEEEESSRCKYLEMASNCALISGLAASMQI